MGGELVDLECQEDFGKYSLLEVLGFRAWGFRI